MNYLSTGDLKGYKFNLSVADDWTPISEYPKTSCKSLIEAVYRQCWKLKILLVPASVYRVIYAHSFCNSLLCLLYDLPSINERTEIHITFLVVMDNLSSLDPIL